MSLERLDIERLLRRLGIEAKKKSKEWEALCPNPEHEDRHPSWRMRDDPGATKHGYHKCWPCGFGGGVVALVQKVLQIEDPRDARAWIEREAPVEQKEVVGIEVKVRSPRIRFSLPDEVIVEPLSKWPKPVREYVEKRGIEPWQVERWGIGYAVEGRLRGRIVFVLRDSNGRPQGYSARLFAGEGKRFLEPEDREQASPSAMFGEQHWSRSDRDVVFVVEGAIKALAIEAALPGACIAATTGSEFRPLHSVKLGTFSRVCLIGDDDEAGNRVSEDLRARLCRETSAERLVLPRGLDADELPREELRGILTAWLGGR